jgi:SAM-dependent methyltransferase
MSSTEYWLEFWKAHGRSSTQADEQTQVLRTFNKQPIALERWQFTLDYLDAQFPIGATDDVLDLCSGNGLFTAHFSPRCRSFTAVDISEDLLNNLDQRKLPNVKILRSDIRKIRFEEGAFSRILLYAGIQYLSYGEAVALFREMFQWLKPGGLLFVGDIPDRKRLWSFYNTSERRALYFDNQIAGRDVVGTWFDESWLLRLAESTGFQQVNVIQQPPEQIYAHFRFDLKAQR